MANSLGSKLPTNTKPVNSTNKSTPAAPNDANRVAEQQHKGEYVIPKALEYRYTFSFSGRRYHERMMELITSNLPARLAKNPSSLMRTGLLMYLEKLVAENQNFFAQEELEEFEALMAHAKENDDT